MARRLREARIRAGLSQRALAFDGCSPAYVSRIEAGERVPSPPLLRELARRVGVSEDYLARGADATKASDSPLFDAEVALSLDQVEEARRLYEQALERAADTETRASALEGLGKLALREGRPREAVDLLTGALDLTNADACERPGLAESLARAHASLGDLPPAIALLERCAARYDREGDAVQYIRFASLLGYALTDAAEFVAAERVVEKALAVGRTVADPYTRARLYWSQSRLRAEQGQSELAERYARKTLETLRATEDTYALAHVLQSLAHINLDLGRPHEAAEYLAEGRPLIAASGTPIEIAHYRIEEIRALAALGEREEAAALAMQTTGALGEAQPVDVGRTYIVLAEIFEDLDDRARARELYELGIDLLEQQGASRYLVDGYRRLSELLEREGRVEEAFGVLKHALRAQERVMSLRD